MAPPLSPHRKLCLIAPENEIEEDLYTDDDSEESAEYPVPFGGRRLSFHSIHGSCIKREQGRFRAVRTDDWYCEGIVFSNRPISIDEKVCIRLSEISEKKKFRWSFRFGVTNVDPELLRDEEFSEYAQRLSKKPGYWIDWLHYSHIKEGNMLEFFVSPGGDIHYSINGEDKGIFLHDINTASPLFAIFDVSESVKAVDFCEWSVDYEKWIPSIGWNDEVDEDGQSAHYARGHRLRFHSIHGDGITREYGRCRVVRTDDSYCDGIVFTNRPIQIDERVCLQLTGVKGRKKEKDAKKEKIAKKERRILQLGVTNIDPLLLIHEKLTDDIDISKESGYWVNWLSNRYISEGGMVQFYVTKNGEMHYNINGNNKGIFLRGINTDLPLWVVVDVYGSVKAVEICQRTFDDVDWDANDYDDKVVENETEDEPTLNPSGASGWHRGITRKLSAAAKWIREAV